MPHVKGDPTKPTPDIGLRGLALLDAIIDLVSTHPDNFNMATWAMVRGVPNIGWDWTPDDSGVPETCGTTMCVAGWAAHLTGAKLNYRPVDRNEYGWVLEASTVQISRNDVPDDWQGDVSYADTMTIQSYAGKVLGIPPSNACELFDASNNLETVRRIRDELAAYVYEEEAG